MAYDGFNEAMTQTQVLSKIKIGEATYALKDSDLRNLVQSFNKSIVTGEIASSVSAGGTGLVAANAVKSYVDAQVGSLNSFNVEVLASGASLPTASASTMYIIYLVPNANSAAQNSYDEWLTIRSGAEGSYTYTWEKIGTTEIDLTPYATKTYVQDLSIAGVKFGEDASISKAELEAETALNLKALAHKDSASGTYVKATGIEGVAYTPAGDVSATKAENGAFQVSGTISQPAVTIAPQTTPVLSAVKTAGTTPSFTEGAFTAATLTYTASDQFVKEGIKASVGSGEDAETLIISDVTNKGTASVITNFSGGSKAADTFTAGAMPTFDTSTALNSETTAALDSAPVFTGDKYNLGFSGTEETITPTLTKEENATITVS